MKNIGSVNVSQAINGRGVSAKISWGTGPTVTVEITGNAGYGAQAHWRIRGANPDTAEYIPNTNAQKKTFEAINGKSYAFQAVWGDRSLGAVFTVNFDSSGNTGGSSGGSSGGSGYEPISVSAKDVYFGDMCAVTWTPVSSAYYKLAFAIGSYYDETEIFRPNTTSLYTYTNWMIPLESATVIPDNTSGIMTVSVIRYEDSNGSKQVGSPGTETFNVTLRDNVVPSIDTCMVSIDNSDSHVLNSWGVALAGYTKVRLTASASGVYGSKIRSYSISGDYNATVKLSDGENTLDYIGLPITSSGNKTFIITCTDSRGRTSLQFITDKELGPITFLPYSPPKVTKFSISKKSNGNIEARSEWVIDSVGGRNSATASIFYKPSTSESWWPYNGGSSINSGDTVELKNLTLSDKTSYNFKIEVTDELNNSANKITFTSTTDVLLDFKAGGKGLGIGKICESDGMEVSMDATFYNSINLLRDAKSISIEDYIAELAKTAINDSKTSIVDAIYPIGSIYMSLKSDNPNALLGAGAWEQLEGRFLLGAGLYSEAGNEYSYEAGATGGERMHVLTEDEMPKHKHWGVTRPSYNSRTGTHPSAVTDGNNINLIETDSTGGNDPHNNMPPYLVVFMWKRVA